jgi:hypothetical protein
VQIPERPAQARVAGNFGPSEAPIGAEALLT